MSLIDKLKVDVGDLIILKNKEGFDRVGYVGDYSVNKVTLSNVYTRYDNGEIRSMSFFNQATKEKVLTFPLRWFDSYEIVKKYNPEDDLKSLKDSSNN